MAKVKKLDRLKLAALRRKVQGEFSVRGSSCWRGVENTGMELFQEQLTDPKQCASEIKRFLHSLTHERHIWEVLIVHYYEYQGKRFHEATETQLVHKNSSEFDVAINEEINLAARDSEWGMEEWRGYIWVGRLVSIDWDASEETIVNYGVERGVYDQTLRKLILEEHNSARGQRERDEASALLRQLDLTK